MKKTVFYALMILLATVVPVTLAEVGLRLYLGDGMTEGALRERLELSSEASVGETGHRSSLFGLVRPSVHHDVIYELKPNLDATFRGQPLLTKFVRPARARARKARRNLPHRGSGRSPHVRLGRRPRPRSG